MTTEKTQADNANKGEGKAKALPNLNQQNMLEKGFEAFGKTTFLKAVKEAAEGLQHIREADIVIMKRQEGNAAIMFKLAVACVKWTMEGDTADLGKAHELMKQACAYNEEVFMADYRKTNPDKLKEEELREKKIRDLAPSWNTMRSEALAALETGQIDPREFKNYSAMHKALKLYRKKERGAGGETNQSEASGAEGGKANDSGGTVKVEVPKKVAETAKVVAKLGDHIRGSISALVVQCQQIPARAQVDASNIIDRAVKEIAALAAKEAEKDAEAVKGDKDTPSETKVAKPATRVAA